VDEQRRVQARNRDLRLALAQIILKVPQIKGLSDATMGWRFA
jgi:hypothetical protein